MSRILYGYRMTETGIVPDVITAPRVKMLFELYISDVSMQKASDTAGVELQINQVKNLLRNRLYAGNDIYPSIVSEELFEKVQEVRQKRTQRLGRDKLKHKDRSFPVFTQFSLDERTEHFDDARLQAQYVYSLIRRKK